MLTSCTLKEISRNDLNGLEGLNCLIITRCKLTTLPEDLFIDMKLLHYVDLSSNRIEFASSKVFEPFVGKDIKRIDLRKNKYLDDFLDDRDSNATVLSVKELMEKVDEYNWKRSENNRMKKNAEDLYGKIGDLWKSCRYSDFTIVVGTKNFFVHKNILAAQSPVFEKIFDEEFEADEVKIQDFSEFSVERLLCFLYTGALPSESDDEEKLVELIKIAAKFEATELKTFCEDKLAALFNDGNSFELFKLSIKIRSENLKRQAFEKIEEEFPRKLNRKTFENLYALEELVNAKRSYDFLLETASK